MTTEVTMTTKGQIAWITLDNPAKRNALTQAGMAQFHQPLKEIRADSRYRVLIVTGSGDRAFCAGASLDQIQAGTITSDTFQALADDLASLPLPKIVAFNGDAYGGGAEIGLCCDFRIGPPGMKLMVPAARFGLCYPYNGIRRFVQRLGPDVAKRMLVAAQTFSAQELIDVGYLHTLTTPDNVQKAADDQAQRLAALAPLAVSAMLKICDGVAGGNLQEDQVQSWITQCNESEDLKAGLKAAVARTTAVFSGT